MGCIRRSQCVEQDPLRAAILAEPGWPGLGELRARGCKEEQRPVVTICESGARAGIAASVLTAAGVDARPVLHGGIGDWTGHTVEFRRCGSAT